MVNNHFLIYKLVNLYLIFSSIKLFSCLYVYQAKEVIEYLNKSPYDKNALDEIKNKISKTFEDFYAFNQIMNNPPQPPFYPNYHNTLNVSDEFKNINTTNKSLYSFYQDLYKIITRTKDYHTYINFNKLLDLSHMIVLAPVSFYINSVDGNSRIFASALENETLMEHFKNFEEVQKVIKNNVNNYIESINDKDPFTFIMEFASDYYNLRNPHGVFTAKIYSYNKQSLSRIPLSIEELTNLKIVFKGGDNFITDYLITSNSEIIPQEYIKNAKKNRHYISKVSFPFQIVDRNKFGVYEFLKEEKFNNDEREWNYNYNNIFKCRVDNDNEMNVYYINSFSTSNLNDYIKIITNCALLFDKNDYKIIFITSLNGGGIAYISQILLELFSPSVSFNLFNRVRISENLEKNVDKLKGASFYTLDKCEMKDFSILIQNKTTAYYGEKLSDTLNTPYIITGTPFKSIINNVKKQFKNPRKPTDLIAFTDYVSFSSTSVFLKTLQYFGGGITVGYFGIPDRDDIPFDSSMSPSPVIDFNSLKMLSPEDFNIINEKYGITMQFAFMQTFYSEEEKNIPLEFGITPVDERFKFYDYYKESNYDNFIKKAKEIFKKYETQCNPKNKRLVLVNKECDGKFENKHTHGGYECGEDGFWTKKCIPSYCDIGYIFDHNLKKCIIDVCADIKNDEEKEYEKEDEDDLTKLEITLIILSSILFICLVAISLFIFFKKRKLSNNIDMTYPINKNEINI